MYHHITYNTMSFVATQDIHSLVHQYEATIIVEDFLRKNKVLQLYSKDLDLRKAYVLVSFYWHLNRIWGDYMRHSKQIKQLIYKNLRADKQI